jgi:hypothetical protein
MDLKIDKNREQDKHFPRTVNQHMRSRSRPLFKKTDFE